LGGSLVSDLGSTRVEAPVRYVNLLAIAGLVAVTRVSVAQTIPLNVAQAEAEGAGFPRASSG